MLRIAKIDKIASIPHDRRELEHIFNQIKYYNNSKKLIQRNNVELLKWRHKYEGVSKIDIRI